MLILGQSVSWDLYSLVLCTTPHMNIAWPLQIPASLWHISCSSVSCHKPPKLQFHLHRGRDQMGPFPKLRHHHLAAACYDGLKFLFEGTGICRDMESVLSMYLCLGAGSIDDSSLADALSL